MKRILSFLSSVVLVNALSAAPPPKGLHSPRAVRPSETDLPPSTARVVSYGERDVVRVRARLRYTTLIVLPKEEKILDFVCGDRDFWVIDGVANIAHIKPAKAGARTNLNLLTASGTVYSFLLREVSDDTQGDPDLKLFVERRDELPRAPLTKTPAPSGPSADEVQKQIDRAKADTRAAQDAAEKQITRYRTEYPIKLKLYDIHKNRAPFFITAMYHDDHFTFIQGKPSEVPALYEIKDGKPNLINFDYHNGTFAVAKILDSGYLVIGKKKLSFTRKD